MADSGLDPTAGLRTAQETVSDLLGLPFLFSMDPTTTPVSALAHNLVLSRGAQAKASPRVHLEVKISLHLNCPVAGNLPTASTVAQREGTLFVGQLEPK